MQEEAEAVYEIAAFTSLVETAILIMIVRNASILLRCGLDF